jgi:hypothetical protein
MTAYNVNTPLRKKLTLQSLRNRMGVVQYAGVINIISDLQSITITKLAWCGACSVYTAIAGWDDFLILLCAFGMRLLTSKELMKLGPKL